MSELTELLNRLVKLDGKMEESLQSLRQTSELTKSFKNPQPVTVEVKQPPPEKNVIGAEKGELRDLLDRFLKLSKQQIADQCQIADNQLCILLSADNQISTVQIADDQISTFPVSLPVSDFKQSIVAETIQSQKVQASKSP